MTHGADVSTSEEVSLFAIVHLRGEMVFAKDALGHRERVTIGGIDGVLETPSPPNLADSPDNAFRTDALVAPEAARSWERSDDPFFWGQQVTPAGSARPEASLIEFRVAASNLRNHSTSVSQSFSNWYSTFVDFHDLLTKKPIRRGPLGSTYSEEHELFVWGDDNQKVRPYDSGPIRLYSPLSSDQDALSRENLSEICRLCSLGSKPSLHYRVQLQAYRALREQDYRKAVIESAVAAEIVLTEVIGKYFQSTGLSYGDKIMEKFRTLGGRLKLAEVVGLSLPDIDFQKAVVDPRNQAIHRAKFFERSDASSVVRAVDQLLQMLSPRRDEQL
ncbi:MAG: hypothetical protein DID90_2727553688 [Candidatus Nitrotoga sp. LAW]|nr:MAG: hypothetical protein DID90_2727553688 [Candidatus Nitrotoga sp. LAW]